MQPAGPVGLWDPGRGSSRFGRALKCVCRVLAEAGAQWHGGRCEGVPDRAKSCGEQLRGPLARGGPRTAAGAGPQSLLTALGPSCVLTRLALLIFAPKLKCVRDLGSQRRREPDFRPVFSLGLQLCPSHVDLGPEPLGACDHEKPVLLWEERI